MASGCIVTLFYESAAEIAFWVQSLAPDENTVLPFKVINWNPGFAASARGVT